MQILNLGINIHQSQLAQDGDFGNDVARLWVVTEATKNFVSWTLSYSLPFVSICQRLIEIVRI